MPRFARAEAWNLQLGLLVENAVGPVQLSPLEMRSHPRQVRPTLRMRDLRDGVEVADYL